MIDTEKGFQITPPVPDSGFLRVNQMGKRKAGTRVVQLKATTCTGMILINHLSVWDKASPRVFV